MRYFQVDNSAAKKTRKTPFFVEDKPGPSTSAPPTDETKSIPAKMKTVTPKLRGMPKNAWQKVGKRKTTGVPDKKVMAQSNFMKHFERNYGYGAVEAKSIAKPKIRPSGMKRFDVAHELTFQIRWFQIRWSCRPIPR